MIRAYKTLPISIKLAIAGLAMLIPLGTLSFFMEIGFRYDIDIGKKELAGTRLLREAYKIQHFISNFRLRTQIIPLPTSKTEALELEAADPDIKIEQALKTLESVGQLKKGTPSYAPDTISCAGLSRVKQAWIWYSTTEKVPAFTESMRASQELIVRIANCANLALDPALDSQMLSRATVRMLPESDALLADLQWMALELIQNGSAHSLAKLQPDQRDAILSKMAYYKDGLLRRTLMASQVALVEDANYYTNSPTLALHYGASLALYQKSASLLFEVLMRMERGQAAPSELFNAASRVRYNGLQLFAIAMDEMDILIKKRIAGYQTWRLFGASMSGIGLLLASLLLMATSRSIARGVTSVVTYTRRVANGDLDAKPDKSELGPMLRNMVNDTQGMVQSLKGKISYLDGILKGMTTPCFIVDRSEIVTFVNGPAMRILDPYLSADEVVGKKLAAIVYDDPEHPTIAGRCMDSGKAIQNERLDFETRTGLTYHLRYDVTPLISPEGKTIGAFAVITDLTQIVEKEKDIERLAAFPREAPDPVLSAGPDGSILYLNTAASRIFESTGLAVDQNFLPEGHEEIVATCLESGTGRPGLEATVGTRSYSWTYHPVPRQHIVHMYATDITKRIRAENQLLHDAFHDTLTGLPNKALFLDRVSQAFRRARSRETQFAVLFMDIDGFKNVNDGLGHSVGDKLLAQFAWRIKKLLGPDETVARLGGDEFTILLPLVQNAQHAMQFANRIQGDLTRPFTIGGHDLFVSASVGVINAPDGASDANDILRDAETAMYRAKAMGRARAEVFDPDMHRDASERIQMENDLKKAVEAGEFEPYYQPIISLATGRIVGFEALIRWNHPQQGLVSPGRFIPLAEETGLIVPMGSFMLETALDQVKQWQMRFPEHRALTISVNMSVVQMTRPAIGSEVLGAINKARISPETVKIEITESGLMNNVGRASELLHDLENMGVSLMIDDFGTGYSSLSHLHQFPFHYLKIDQSFVSSMGKKEENTDLVRSIIAMSHTLNKQVVAEGVETKEQKEQLTEFGCEFVQGYYFSRPVPASDAEALLAENPKW